MKAWLYMDKLRLTEPEELALLSSVGNRYEAQLLQQAALQDRRSRPEHTTKGKNPWYGGSRGSKGSQEVHITEAAVAEEDLTDKAPEGAARADGREPRHGVCRLPGC